jgi:hypothetical protein
MRLVRLAAVDKREHGAPQRLGPANIGIACHGADGGGSEFDRGIGVDRPMGDQQGSRLRVDEGARQPRQRFAFVEAPAAVLQAKRITQSASRLRPAISDADG